MFKRLFLATLLLSMAGNLFASITLQPYIGGEVGSTSYTSSNGGNSTTTSAGIGWGGFLGVALTRHFAVEGDYTSYGTMDNSSLYLTSAGILLKATADITPVFDIFGKAGFSNVTVHNGGSDDSGSGFAFALGAGFRLTRAMEVFGQYQADLAEVDTTQIKPSMWSLGLQFKF